VHQKRKPLLSLIPFCNTTIIAYAHHTYLLSLTLLEPTLHPINRQQAVFGEKGKKDDVLFIVL